jgi:hypothetical protein
MNGCLHGMRLAQSHEAGQQKLFNNAIPSEPGHMCPRIAHAYILGAWHKKIGRLIRINLPMDLVGGLAVLYNPLKFYVILTWRKV